MQITRDDAEVIEDATGHEDDDDSLRSEGRNRIPHSWFQNIMPSDGAVIIEGKDRKLHRTPREARPDLSVRPARSGHAVIRCFS